MHSDVRRRLASIVKPSSVGSVTPTGTEPQSRNVSRDSRYILLSGSELDEEMPSVQSEDSNESWTVAEEFSSEYILRYGSRYTCLSDLTRLFDHWDKSTLILIIAVGASRTADRTKSARNRLRVRFLGVTSDTRTSTASSIIPRRDIPKKESEYSSYLFEVSLGAWPRLINLPSLHKWGYLYVLNAIVTEYERHTSATVVRAIRLTKGWIRTRRTTITIRSRRPRPRLSPGSPRNRSLCLWWKLYRAMSPHRTMATSSARYLSFPICRSTLLAITTSAFRRCSRLTINRAKVPLTERCLVTTRCWTTACCRTARARSLRRRRRCRPRSRSGCPGTHRATWASKCLWRRWLRRANRNLNSLRLLRLSCWVCQRLLL